MSTKTATKVSKTATKAAPAKTATKTAKAPVKAAAAPVKVGVVRLTEADKAADLETYILNPATKKHVKRDTVLGKKLVEAEESGETVEKAMTETERLIFLVKHIQAELDIADDTMKAVMEKVVDHLPRGFPATLGGKHKEPRHEEHPKGPSNAYIFFTMAVRESTVAANPDLSNTEIVSLMAKMWKETPEDARTEYEAKAAADKERYETEMAAFETKYPEEARASTKAASTPEKPTKATAYLMFCRENREQAKADNDELDGKEITKLLAEQWAEVKEDKDELAKYQAMADEANEDLAERLSDYNSSPGASPKKLSESEQKKADDPENYELNPKTGRYVKKAKKASPKAKSPKTPTKKAATKKAAPAAPKKAEKKAEKTDDEAEKDEDDDLLVA
jgi:hypothetical protein